jgi:hypothetical protein
MLKKVFALESLCSETQSTLSRCRGELDIALLEKQMLTKIDEQRRLSQLQSSDSYHSQLELDYKASQETIDELRKKCDNYQSSWFQFEKKIREEKRDWQHSKEQELRLIMEVSMNERVGTIEAEIKVLLSLCRRIVCFIVTAFTRICGKNPMTAKLLRWSKYQQFETNWRELQTKLL